MKEWLFTLLLELVLTTSALADVLVSNLRA